MKFSVKELLNETDEDQEIIPRPYEVEFFAPDEFIKYPSDAETIKEIIEIYGAMKEEGLSSRSSVWEEIFRHKQTLWTSLETGDKKHLSFLLSNLFVTGTSTGLVSRPMIVDNVWENKEICSKSITSMLINLNFWLETNGYDKIPQLSIGRVGNPYGLFVNNTIIAPDSPRHYHHAKILKRWGERVSSKPVILEIGGGYGGVAHYYSQLLKDFCYINCDLEDSLIISYYFLKTSFLSVGETLDRLCEWRFDKDISHTASDFVFVPAHNFEAIHMAPDIVYNCNSFSEMTEDQVDKYFWLIRKLSPKIIFHQNAVHPEEEQREILGVRELSADKFPVGNDYELVHYSVSPWWSVRGDYREFYYVRKDLLTWNEH